MPANHRVPHTDEAKRKMSAAKAGKPNLKKRRKCVIVDGVESFECSGCKAILPREAFYASKKQTSGIHSQCKKCHNAVSVATRDVDKARDASREYMRRVSKASPGKNRGRKRKPADPIKQAARMALHNAIRRREIVRPETCQECGVAKKVTAHHSDYSKPLDVEWLCYECHGLRHRR